MEKQFCPSCGNATLIRTSCSVNAQGQFILYLKKNFQYNKRGTQYSLPQPKGGKECNDIILREDQKEYQKAYKHYQHQKSSLDPFDLEFIPLGNMCSKRPISKPTIGYGRRNVNQVTRKKK